MEHNDEAEWKALENEREDFNGRDCGVKFSNTPHPKSAYAHLPMRQAVRHFHTDLGDKKRAIALWPEPKRMKFRSPVSGKIVKDAKVLIKKAAPHPASYRPDLPLSGLGLEGGYPVRKWTLSAEEKRTLADRPLKYTVSAQRSVERTNSTRRKSVSRNLL